MEGTELELELDLELRQLYLLMNSTLKGYMEGTELELDLELKQLYLLMNSTLKGYIYIYVKAVSVQTDSKQDSNRRHLDSQA